MTTPQPGFPAQGQQGYEQPQHEQYDENQQDVPENASSAHGAPPTASHAGRKKRNYAGQAYDFGGGANSALGGQQQGGGQYPPPPAAGYGGYAQAQPHQPPQQQPGWNPAQGFTSNPVSPAVGGAPGYSHRPQAVGGYQPPEPAYPAHGTPQPQPGVGGLTEGMGNMHMGGQAPNQAPQIQGRPPMNQLYPTDLLNQSLNVEELDFPPPPIILPPNVSHSSL